MLRTKNKLNKNNKIHISRGGGNLIPRASRELKGLQLAASPGYEVGEVVGLLQWGVGDGVRGIVLLSHL